MSVVSARFLAVGASVVLFASCTTGGVGSSEMPSRDAVSIDSGPNDFEAFFWPDTSDEQAYDTELDEAIGACMRERGFDYVSNLVVEGSNGQQPSAGFGGPDFGVVDSYADAAGGAAPAAVTPLQAYLERLSGPRAAPIRTCAVG